MRGLGQKESNMQTLIPLSSSFSYKRRRMETSDSHLALMVEGWGIQSSLKSQDIGSQIKVLFQGCVTASDHYNFIFHESHSMMKHEDIFLTVFLM